LQHAPADGTTVAMY